MTAFDWHIYDDRRKALEHLKNNLTLVDTIIETEDGRAHEPVHSQVMSAFGNKLTKYIEQNGLLLVDSSNQSSPQHAFRCLRPEANASNRARSIHKRTHPAQPTHSSSQSARLFGHLTRCNTNKLKLVRLPKVNKYTLGILIECAYSGYIRTDLASGGIWQVLEMADHYEMSDVIRACCAFLTKNLNQSNCIYFYHVGIKHKHALQRFAWHQIRANFKHILAQNLAESSNDLARNGILGPNWANLHLQLSAPDAGRQLEAGITGQASGVQSQAVRNEPVPMIAASQAEPVVLPSRPSASARQAPASRPASGRALIDARVRANNLATIKYEHFEPLLLHDKLNVDNEESIWYAIKLWCNYNLGERAPKVADLLPCMRFPRFRTGTEFVQRYIWRDPLIINNDRAQNQLAVLDRNHRGFLGSLSSRVAGRGLKPMRDGFNLPCAALPRQLRPRIPHSVLLAIGGWQQGQPTTLIESYDTNCNLWFESRRRINSPLAYHGIEYIDGLLYICGGTDGSDILRSLITFDPVTSYCNRMPSMQDARCYVSTAHLNEHLYALGGHNGSQRMRSVERFELKKLVWSHVQDMHVARSDASACVYESHIYIAGGLNDVVVESSVEFYNPADNTWTFIRSMLVQRTSFELIAYRNTLLAVGGNNGTERLNSVEQYDFETKAWTIHSQMRHKRSTFSAALIDDSKLVVVGGYNGTSPFSQVEMFDECSRQWISLQKIRYDRSGLKAVVVKDLPNASEYTFLGSQAQQLAAQGVAAEPAERGFQYSNMFASLLRSEPPDPDDHDQ